MPDPVKVPDLLVFPKFFQSLSVEQLGKQMLACGFDGVDVIIRTGYWCAEDNYLQTLPDFVRTIRQHGLKAYTATTNWTHENLPGIEDAYRLFADNGITMFRFWMQDYRGHQNFRAALDTCRQSLSRLESLGQKYGVQALIQTHGGTMTWSPEAAWLVVHDFDPRAIGVHYDPANMWTQEGWTNPAKSIDVLGDHLSYVGVKNGGWFLAPDPKNDQRLAWRTEWMRLDLGMVNWTEVVRELQKANFAGPYCMHNFYTNTLEGLVEGIRADVEFFRQLIQKV